ncbi:molecular chaperone [Stenotrophomonas cyclobalanopsidis]|uniref:fimbrial biogenesis chaperone n=1 Tax=Stenotrophomonas cyclobalanopsidis TaxID=2771362 RepID=UPI00345FD8B8
MLGRYQLKNGRRHHGTLATATLLCGVLFSPVLQASVTLNTTRVIYNESQLDRIVRFTNEASDPRLVQVWTDRGDPNSTIESADSPFVVSPQMFRIEPGAGQVVRLIIDRKESLPADRESIFYLNFVQFPALPSNEQDKNKLVLVISSRLKILYRPLAVEKPVQSAADMLKVEQNAQGIAITNPTPLNVVVVSAALHDGATTQVVPHTEVVPPLSKVVWAFRNTPPKGSARTLRLAVVNDFGATVNAEYSLP